MSAYTNKGSIHCYPRRFAVLKWFEDTPCAWACVHSTEWTDTWLCQHNVCIKFIPSTHTRTHTHCDTHSQTIWRLQTDGAKSGHCPNKHAHLNPQTIWRQQTDGAKTKSEYCPVHLCDVLFLIVITCMASFYFLFPVTTVSAANSSQPPNGKPCMRSNTCTYTCRTCTLDWAENNKQIQKNILWR